jgi:pyruvate formate lyase activating enzyme
MHPAQWWHALPDGRLQCDVCPRECKLHAGQRGACFVRLRPGDDLPGNAHSMALSTYGRSSGFCIDPIEKKPLNHFYPGSSVLSFGTAGCNLACKFCQNWDISKSRDTDTLAAAAMPEDIARAAQQAGCKSVAYTYNDPVIFAEYAIDVAQACHAVGVQSVAVTAGYVHDAPRRALFAHMHAANVDLKGFTESFYAKLCAGKLAPVLDTLQYIKQETDCWLEITTLLIPGENDSDAEITALSRWVMDELGPDVPLHFTAFHPDYKMRDTPATPPASVKRARAIAKAQGLRYVYTGNIVDPDGGSTDCPGCGQRLISRDWHAVAQCAVGEAQRCPHCATHIAGRFGATFDSSAQAFGRRRIPVAIHSPNASANPET